MKETFKLIAGAIALVLIISAIGGCKYALWRAEHPGAKTWTFFIPGK